MIEQNSANMIYYWIGGGGLLGVLSSIVAYTASKVSQKEYDKFEKRQCIVNDKVEVALNKNSKVLTQVETMLNERTK